MSRSLQRVLLVGASLALASACGGVKHVDQKILADLPFDGKLDLLDAENDLFIALDRMDEAEEAARVARADLEEAGERVSAARSESKSAKGEAAAVTKMAIEEAEARVGYLKLARVAVKSEVEAAEVGLNVARAKLEKARCEIAKRYKAKGSEQLKQEKFDGVVAKYEAELKKANEASAKKRKEAELERGRWSEKRRLLADRTGGARGSPWVE
jgi:chromosome segregation ATPase